MKVSGVLDMLAERELFIMLMETSIAEIGITINVTDMEYIKIKIKLVTKDIGKMICNMVREKKHGLKDRNTKGIM
jgi:hypothetical protein